MQIVTVRESVPSQWSSRPNLGYLGNTLETTTPFSATVRNTAARLGYTGASPGWFLVNMMINAAWALRSFDPIAALPGVTGSQTPTGRILKPFKDAWEDFQAGACETGTTRGDVVAKLQAIGALVSAVTSLPGVSGRAEAGQVSQINAAGVIGEIARNVDRLVAETRSALCPAAPIGPTTKVPFWAQNLYHLPFGTHPTQQQKKLSTGVKVAIGVAGVTVVGLIVYAIAR